MHKGLTVVEIKMGPDTAAALMRGSACAIQSSRTGWGRSTALIASHILLPINLPPADER